MKFKFLKAASLGLALSISGLANAGIITLNDTTAQLVGSTLEFNNFLTVSLTGGGVDTGAPIALPSYITNGSTLTANTYPTANQIVFAFDQLVWNVAFDIDPAGIRDSGQGMLTIEAFNGATSLGEQVVSNGNFHSESLSSFGAMTSFVVSNGCTLPSGVDSCNWYSKYSEVSYDVPEPSTLAIFALGLMGLSLRRTKKQA